MASRFVTQSISGWLVVLVLLVSACGTLAAPPTPTPEAKGGGGEFRVVVASEPVSLNPNLRTDDAAFNVSQSIYNKLVTLDADYRVIPDLATRWDISTDGLTYTFYLAQNVKWHDGTPFTAADVKWTFETIAREKGFVQELANRIASIETPDATTVVMRLKETWSPFISSVAWYGTFILPQRLYENTDWTKTPVNEKPVGTGPFKFVEWVKGDHITLAANRDYFQRGPFLDQVTYRFLKDPTTAPDLIVKGEVDYMQAAPARERVADLAKQPGVSIKTFSSPNRYFLGFNFLRKPFDDLRVRQALNMATDRSALLARAFAGLGTPATGMLTPAIPWAYNANVQAPALDTAGAEKLLDQAGLKRGADGMRAKFTLVTANQSPFTESAKVLQEQWRAIGIDLNVVLLAPADATKRISPDKDFDVFVLDGLHGPDPDNLALRFGSKGTGAYTGYTSADFDAAVAEGARYSQLQDRVKAYARAQEILARDLPMVPLVDHALVIFSRANVTGLPQAEARGFVTFQNYSLVRIKR